MVEWVRRSVPAISGFGQKSNGQSSSLGGFVQYAATYFAMSRVRLRQLTAFCERVSLTSSSKSIPKQPGGEDVMSAEGKGEKIATASWRVLCMVGIDQMAGWALFGGWSDWSDDGLE